MPVNARWSQFSLFSRLVGIKVCRNKQHYHCHTNLTEEEGEVIISAPLKFADLNDGMFHVVEMLLHLKGGCTTYVGIENITLGLDAVL